MTANHDQPDRPNRASILTQMVQNLHAQMDNPVLANSPVIREIQAAAKQRTPDESTDD